MNVRRTLLIIAIVLGAAACSSDGDSADTATTTSASAEQADGSTASTSADSCPSETLLVVSGSQGIDGELELVTAFADVTLDQSADLVFATYEIPEDPQFGVSAPVGDPEAPPGGVIFQLTLVTQEDVLPMGDYPEDGTSPTRIAFVAMHNGSERILPLGEHTVTITDYSDERICGEITAGAGGGAQSFPVVEGTFNLVRV